MVLPIVNQPDRVRTNNLDGAGSFYERAKRTRQGKPFNEPAPYYLDRCYTVDARLIGDNTSFGALANAGASSDWTEPGPGYLESWSFTGDAVATAVNSARKKLLSQMNESAMLAVNYIERQQSMNMIQSRALQLLRFTRALRRGDISRAAQELQVQPPSSIPSPRRRGWRKSTDYANAWLEFHFGWEPLVKDIGSCVEILQGPVPAGKFSARGKPVSLDKFLFIDYKNPWREKLLRDRKGWVKAACSGEFHVSNPDLYLANKLGFVNPATVLWEAIPYSFVVDWFANVSDFLESFSDLSGLTVQRPCYSVICRVTTRRMYTYVSGKAQGYDIRRASFYARRYRGFPSVTLGIPPLKRLSVSRAATAISLLLQKLK